MSAFKRFRSAISGRFVAPQAAASHPHTVIAESVDQSAVTANVAEHLIDDSADWLLQRLLSEPRLSTAKADAIANDYRRYMLVRLGIVRPI